MNLLFKSTAPLRDVANPPLHIPPIITQCTTVLEPLKVIRQTTKEQWYARGELEFENFWPGVYGKSQ